MRLGLTGHSYLEQAYPQRLDHPLLLDGESRDDFHRVASYRRDSNHWRSLAVISPLKTQKKVFIGLVFVALRFKSRDWRSFM